MRPPIPILTYHQIDATPPRGAAYRSLVVPPGAFARQLERLLDTEVRHFCYPYGAHRPEHAQMARDSGFITATTTTRSRALESDDLFELPRVPVHRTASLPLLWAKLATRYEDRRRQ